MLQQKIDSIKEELYQVVREFIKERKISCPEAIYQSDEVILNAYKFIEKLCEIVGYDVDE